MIKVSRAAPPTPTNLLKRARDAREDFFRENAHRLAQVRVPKPDSIALRYLVKPLRKNFEGKCGFCEQRADDGMLTHFRPPSVHDIGESITSSHLHYSWLVYDWDNVIYSCSVCAMAKSSLFPVNGERAAVSASVKNCRSDEDAHLLDPTYDDPTEHLRFDSNGNCLSLTERGGRTISILNLNRTELIKSRRDLISAMWAIFKEGIRLIKEDKPNLAVVSALLGFTSNEAEFAGVARSALTTWMREYSSLNWPPEIYEQLFSQGIYPDLGKLRKEKQVRQQKDEKAIGRSRLPPFANHSLTRIEIENFKGIARADFDLAPSQPDPSSNSQAVCLVLLGENSVGKSSVLEAVSLALTGRGDLSKLKISADKYFLRGCDWNEKRTDGAVRLFFDKNPHPDIVLKINSVTKQFELTEKKQVVLAAYGPRRFYVEGKTAIANKSLPGISSLFNYFAYLDDPGSWLLNTEPDDFNAAVRALREVLMLPEDDVDFIKEMDGGSLNIFISSSTHKTPLNFMSDGYKTVIAMAIDIIRHMLKYYSNLESAKGIILIDEIDTHLHPRWKIEILKRLRLAFPQIQFIVSTHDPLCLRGAKDGEVAVLRKYGFTTEVITELPNVESLSIEQLLTSEYFGLLSTEDPITERRKARHLELSRMRNRTLDEEEELKNVRTALLSKMQFGQSEESRLLYEAATEYLREKKKSRSSAEKLSSKTVGKMLSILKNGSNE
ncbi:AAA family ATPase [Janthinobacterium lividum]|uniref:AAA family ATPase n=1 Tax=Janthinobacterium lividum TaxID=29581 RepID=UPI0015959B4A|nr:AAA family ATPase [Janthinobacterium lividum]QKY12083.1 AAA family ATPase [Janthinobacterium lividum]